MINKVKSFLDKNLEIKSNDHIKNQLIKPFIDNINYFSYEHIAKEMFNIDQQSEIKFKKQFTKNINLLRVYKLFILGKK